MSGTRLSLKVANVKFSAYNENKHIQTEAVLSVLSYFLIFQTNPILLLCYMCVVGRNVSNLLVDATGRLCFVIVFLPAYILKNVLCILYSYRFGCKRRIVKNYFETVFIWYSAIWKK